jgi:hypothetical protein
MATKAKIEHSLEDLESLYSKADSADKDLFAEQRSNLLLVAGEHYTKKTASFFRRLRDSKSVSEEVKLRLTKNHIQKIVRTYVNNIVSLAPGVTVMPKNESEIQDQKAAEMNNAVWLDGVDRHGVKDLVDDWGDDFVGIGEVAVKIIWDPSAGKIKAYEQKMDDQGASLFLDPEGEETTDPNPHPETGEPQHRAAPGAPVYSGDFVLESIYGFNLLRDPDSKAMPKSPYLILRKMSDTSELKAKFAEFEGKIQASQDDTMVVFDGVNGKYAKAENQVLVKEIYFRPCPQYPRGYFYIWTTQVILAQGELPGGIFPVLFQAFDKVQTSPRGRSPIKTMRPYQVEINRAASKIAEHQITLGDDKLLIQNGTKISAGAALPGVRAINYSGMEPGILNGRDGSQYLNYMQAQIAELYDVMNVAEDSAQKTDGAIDPFALLFKSATQKKKFSRYVRRFESFLQQVCFTYLELAKLYLPDEAVIYATGKKEQVNIPEFRNTEALCYQIKVEPQADDIESKLGKQMMLNHALQYVGNKLEKEDIGKIMRAMPYANSEESFSDLTLDYDSGTNLLLALDRGEQPQVNQYDNFVYLIKRLVARMRQADFKFLPPMAQMSYQRFVQALEQQEALRQQKLLAAEQGFIPTGGYMVTTDLYVSDPTNPLKTRRARVPYESLAWLIKTLEDQGNDLDQLESMNQGALSQMAGMIQNRGPGANGMAPGASPQGNAMPGGVAHGSPNGGASPVPVPSLGGGAN